MLKRGRRQSNPVHNHFKFDDITSNSILMDYVAICSTPMLMDYVAKLILTGTDYSSYN